MDTNSVNQQISKKNTLKSQLKMCQSTSLTLFESPCWRFDRFVCWCYLTLLNTHVDTFLVPTLASYLNFRANFMGFLVELEKKRDTRLKSGEHNLQHNKSFFRGGWVPLNMIKHVKPDFSIFCMWSMNSMQSMFTEVCEAWLA